MFRRRVELIACDGFTDSEVYGCAVPFTIAAPPLRRKVRSWVAEYGWMRGGSHGL